MYDQDLLTTESISCFYIKWHISSIISSTLTTGVRFTFLLSFPAFNDAVRLYPRLFGSLVRSAACDVICRHALSAVLSPPSGGGRAAATVTSSLLLWVLEGDQESCSEVLAERWQALRLRVVALADEVRCDTTKRTNEPTNGNKCVFACRNFESIQSTFH